MPRISNRSYHRGFVWPLVVLLIAFGAFYFKPWQTKPQETISVTAEGQTEVAPDIAQISAIIETKNQNLETARQQNEQKVQVLLTKLKEVGIEEKDIKTINLQAPGSEPPTLIYPSPPRPNSKVFSASFEIKIRNFDLADEVVAVLTQNGAINLYGPSLTLSTETQERAKATAREKAVESARQKAEQLAKLSGRKLGDVVKVQEQEGYYPIPILARGEADLQQKASSIQPGQNEVTVNIQVEFELD